MDRIGFVPLNWWPLDVGLKSALVDLGRLTTTWNWQLTGGDDKIFVGNIVVEFIRIHRFFLIPF